MNNKEAFLYIWYDDKLGMNYLGYHKGDFSDGYICSHVKPQDGSPWMLEEYKRRPADFTRIILAEGSARECRKWEEMILTHFDAAKNPQWYNRHNGGINFVVPVGHLVSPETKRKISEATKGKRLGGDHKRKISESNKKYYVLNPEGKRIFFGSDNPMYGKQHSLSTKRKIGLANKFCSEETRRKKSESHKGKKISDETKLKMSVSHRGKHHSEETRLKISKSRVATVVSFN